MRRKTIQYAIDLDLGQVISRVNDRVLIPVLDFEGMKPENNFKTNYDLQEFSIYDISQNWYSYKWTKKIPIEIKNLHRQKWNMKLLTN